MSYLRLFVLTLAAVLGLGLSACLEGDAFAAEFEVTPDKIGIFMQGEIMEGDADKLVHFVTAHSLHGETYRWFGLSSPGGEYIAGTGIAAYIHGMGLNTYIPSGSVCASMCSLIFAAGKERWMEYGSMLGVHSIRSTQQNGTWTEDDGAKSTTVDLVRWMKLYDAPNEVVVQCMLTDPGKMWWFSPAQVEMLGWVQSYTMGQ